MARQRGDQEGMLNIWFMGTLGYFMMSSVRHNTVETPNVYWLNMMLDDYLSWTVSPHLCRRSRLDLPCRCGLGIDAPSRGTEPPPFRPQGNWIGILRVVVVLLLMMMMPLLLPLLLLSLKPCWEPTSS